jgi:hypothetical protein
MKSFALSPLHFSCVVHAARKFFLKLASEQLPALLLRTLCAQDVALVILATGIPYIKA